MPSTPPEPDTGHYIVRSTDPAALAAFLDDASRDHELTVVDRIGPAGQPHTAVLAMSRAKAAALEQRFDQASPLKIEPDRPLSLFGHVGNAGNLGPA